MVSIRADQEIEETMTELYVNSCLLSSRPCFLLWMPHGSAHSVRTPRARAEGAIQMSSMPETSLEATREKTEHSLYPAGDQNGKKAIESEGESK